MKIQISKILIGLLLVTLFPLAFVPAFNVSFASPIFHNVPLATDTYTEDFTTTTYRNLGQTTTSGWGSGIVTNARGYSSQLLDSFMTPGEVMSIDVQGRILYASINQSSPSNAFGIFDINNPTDIKQMSTPGSWAFQEPVAVSGDLAAMGGGLPGSEGVGLYNVTDPFNPSIIMPAIYFDGNLTDLEYQGHHLYLANYDSPGSLSFRVIDVADPNLPVLLPMGYLSPNVHGLTVEGHFVYLAEGLTGLNIMNITNPKTPTPVDTVNTPGFAMDVIVDGGLAFVADGTGGVQIVDIRNPSSSSIIGGYDTAGEARHLALQGDTLFVADSANGLVVLDVTDPTHPLLVDTIGVSYAWDVDLYGEIVCIGGDAGIYTYRIGLGMANLEVIGVYDGGFDIKDVRVQGDIAYVAAGTDGFLTVDVSDPAAPVLLDQYTTSITNAIKLDVQGHIVAVIENSWFHLFNVLDPTDIRLYATLPFGGGRDVFLWGELCFYSWEGPPGGVGYYNISNPYSPTWTQWSVGSNITAIWVQGSYLYAVDDVGGWGNSFYIYDISDLSNFQQIEVVFRLGYHYDIFVDGNVAYFADDDPVAPGYASVFNITDPFNTFLTEDLYNDTLGVWGYGPWLITADQQDGVSLHNTTDLSSANTLFTESSVTAARAVTIHGNYAYVANTTNLVILHLVRAAGNTYGLGTNVATSLEVDSTTETIENATLTYVALEPTGTSISFDMSADGGSTWESVTPGLLHTFATPGNDLRWRSHLTTPSIDRSVRLASININYEYVEPPPTTPPPPPPLPLLSFFLC